MEKIVRKSNRMQQKQINDVYSNALSSPPPPDYVFKYLFKPALRRYSCEVKRDGRSERMNENEQVACRLLWTRAGEPASLRVVFKQINRPTQLVFIRGRLSDPRGKSDHSFFELIWIAETFMLNWFGRIPNPLRNNI